MRSLIQKIHENICTKTGRYVRNTAGTIAVAFAIMVPVIVGSAGMALDFAQAYLVQQRLAQALDAAALAAAASYTDEADIQQKVNEFFDANYPEEKLGVTFEPTVHVQGNEIIVGGSAYYGTFFLHVIGIEQIEVAAETEVTKVLGNNIELALVLDVSGSMNNFSKINDLRNAAKSLVETVVYDDQSEYYSKIAIVPYGVAVNVGSYAATARGPITAGKTITGATRANPVVITSANHGFITGDRIRITNVNGMTQLNNQTFTVSVVNANSFRLRNSTNTSNINGSGYSSYSSGGTAYCTTPGCQYLYFQSPSNTWNTFQVSTCVTERTGPYAYTDNPPSDAYVGRNYPSAVNNPCLTSQILPLTSDKDLLDDHIDALVASGSTGGQVGVGWGWYMLSPEWDFWSDSESVAGEYGAEDLHKIVVLMTDGEYNSPYCNGAIARDATSGSGSASDHINCDATNGNSYEQAETMCDAMKADDVDIEIYTIGFRVNDYPRGEALMEYCATDEDHFYTADDGDELQDVFQAIANNVSSLYLSR